ncbi:hypothetical protein KAT80_03155 [Candidatus Pacearchaeota archaeon]|nr:hypothetical protein [Candidatus Pacearchaeota archaeon]
MKKSVSYFLILNLFLSIVALSFLVNFSIPIIAAYKIPEGFEDVALDDGFYSDEDVTLNKGDYTNGKGTYWDSETNKFWKYQGNKMVEVDASGNLLETANQGADLPSATGTPTGYSSHGYAGQAGESLFGAESVAPKGYEWQNGKWVKTGSLDASSGLGYSTTGILQGVIWAGMVAMAVQVFAPMFGADGDQTNAISTALGAGVFAGKTMHSLLGKGGVGQNWFGMKSGLSAGWSWVGGAAVAAIIFYSMYKSEETETKIFTCEPWQAPTGGANCEKCNKQGILPCSEYQCRSLGQACELLNPGTDEESCTWVNRHDVNPPVIKPLNDALLDGYVYVPDNTISPPDKGVKVQNTALASKCAEAFTPLTFGIITNEPAQCKISILREKSFDDMTLYFGGSNLFKYNHTQVMVLPGADALNESGITIDSDGNFEVFTRCQDANGNANVANFVFKYCVEKGPDTTPPLIVTTSLLNNMPIAYDQTSVEIDVYTNEPADCRWSHLDKSYENMEQTMTCAKSVSEVNTQMLYTCTTTLTGLKNEVDNNFYFRCKDLAENTNAESYLFTLIGTRPLVIDSVSPNATTLKDSTDIIQVNLQVQTSAGYKDGESICYYSDTGAEDSYVMFFNTNSYNHSQELWLAAGNYEYFIKCLDLGGNTDQETINFVVESDSTSPLVVRVYHEEPYLKLVTNEEAECVYDTVSCSYTFEDGIKMNNIDGITHYIDWDTQTNFYIKCKDSYGNKPFPDKCNIIAKPSQIF